MNGPGDLSKKLIIRHLSELPQAAGKILADFSESKIFAFYGRMGAGKTTLIQQLCSALGVTDQVTSPTFAIINVYSTEIGDSIYHFDFYRIEDITEIMDIGYEEYFSGDSYCFLEWPEKVENLLPEDTVRISIVTADDEQTRLIQYL